MKLPRNTKEKNFSCSFGKIVLEAMTGKNQYWIPIKAQDPLVDGFQPYDFRNWYDEAADQINGITEKDGIDFLPSNPSRNSCWKMVLGATVATCDCGKGRLIVCGLQKLESKVRLNPAAWMFVRRWLEEKTLSRADGQFTEKQKKEKPNP